ncbi:MAG: hypothetical protein MZV70_22575 [Desulfobacterales bacterium]|nr:hypothetical protein [Desulfobacterales bacterium]
MRIPLTAPAARRPGVVLRSPTLSFRSIAVDMRATPMPMAVFADSAGTSLISQTPTGVEDNAGDGQGCEPPEVEVLPCRDEKHDIERYSGDAHHWNRCSGRHHEKQKGHRKQ